MSSGTTAGMILVATLVAAILDAKFVEPFFHSLTVGTQLLTGDLG